LAPAVVVDVQLALRAECGRFVGLFIDEEEEEREWFVFSPKLLLLLR
jgi:hypothetical protein